MSNAPIGIFDSGVGGLTVFRTIERALPGRPLVYLGDTARVPYGTRSPEAVVRYSLEAARFMQTEGVETIVVACNTASSVALKPMFEATGIETIGVIEPGAARAVERTKNKKIGVIGTRATISSGAYARAIERIDPAVEVISQACPLLVPLAEEGWVDNDVAERVAERYLEPLIRADVDTVVLGCTHYPLLRGVIGATLGWEVTLVDSAESVARTLGDRSSDPSTGEAQHRFYVTDVPDPFRAVAERFLGRTIEQLEQTRIDD